MKFKSFVDLLKVFNTEEKCHNLFVSRRWRNGLTCPHCKNHESEKKIYTITKRMIFRCGACAKDFTVRTGTFLGDTKVSYQNWLIAIYFVTSHKKGISSLQLAINLGVTQKTAWFMIQRILHVASTESHNILSGVVELDETYVGGKESNKYKHPSRQTQAQTRAYQRRKAF